MFLLISSPGLCADIGGVTTESIFVELLRVEVDTEIFFWVRLNTLNARTYDHIFVTSPASWVCAPQGILPTNFISTLSLTITFIMTPTTPPSLDFRHKKGYEIPTKHKEAIRQLHWFGKVPICALMHRYKLGDSTIRKILTYPAPERRRPNRTGPSFLLSDAKVDEIITYCAES